MGRVQGSGQEYCENGKENHVGRSSQLLVEFADIPDREPVLHMVCQFQACSAGVFAVLVRQPGHEEEPEDGEKQVDIKRLNQCQSQTLVPPVL